jgi:hypothetical protein
MLSKTLIFVGGLLTALALWAVIHYSQPSDQREGLLKRNAGSHWGIKLNVTYELHILRDFNNGNQLFSGQAIYKIHNWDNKAWKFKMPPVRSMIGSANDMQYVQADQHQKLWNDTKDFQLLPGETKFFRHEIEYLTNQPLQGDLSNKKDAQTALVFDLPDDADVKEWVTGTILSEPIEWDKSQLK